MNLSIAAVFSSGFVKIRSDSASEGRLIKDMAVARAGAVAMRNPAEVKTTERAESASTCWKRD